MIDIDVVIQKLEERIVEFERITEFYENNPEETKVEISPVSEATNFYEIENRTFIQNDSSIEKKEKEANLKKFLSHVTKNVITNPRAGSENLKEVKESLTAENKDLMPRKLPFKTKSENQRLPYKAYPVKIVSAVREEAKKIPKSEVCVRNPTKEATNNLNAKGRSILMKSLENPVNNGKSHNQKPYTPKTIKPLVRKSQGTKNDVKPKTQEELKSDLYCKICDKYFSKPYSLTRHVYLHTGYRPYSCHVCHREFIQRSDLERHLTVHDDNPQFECHVCETKFRTKKSLACHMLFHNSATPYSCDKAGCTKQFRSRKMFKIHQIVAHFPKDRKFVCDLCGKKFMLKEYLKTHLNIHCLGGLRFAPKNRKEFELQQSFLKSKKLKRMKGKEKKRTTVVNLE